MKGIQLQKLTDYDPVRIAEGALDPLGLYAIAENFAVKLVPGNQERMSHPRFLTAIAAAVAINREFEQETSVMTIWLSLISAFLHCKRLQINICW